MVGSANVHDAAASCAVFVFKVMELRCTNHGNENHDIHVGLLSASVHATAKRGSTNV